MAETADTHDPGVNPEEEGIPDLQDGSPQAARASDPQQASVPGEKPVASDKHGTTTLEQMTGESLEDKLREEEPDIAGPAADDVADPEAGQLSDEPLAERPANQDVFAHESPADGLSSEEAAVHVTGLFSGGVEGEVEEVGETEEPVGPKAPGAEAGEEE